MILHQGFHYRIYPTVEQAARLDQWNDALRFLWNLAHEQRLVGLAHSRGYRRYFTAFDQINELTGLRTELPWLADVPRNVTEQLFINLDQAWQRCFKRLGREPQWKCRGRDVIGFTETHPKIWHLDGDALHFPKIGPIRTVVHRPLVGKPKTCTIKRDGDQWFCSITCEVEVTDPLPSTKPAVGIDRGCVNLLADSNGRIVENPHHLRLAEQRLTRAQRNVSRKKKGSKNREKAKLRVARIHRKIRRQRDHVLHCESKRYAESQGTIFVEKLQITNMSTEGGSHKHGLNRSIMSAGWGKFVEMCKYKVVPLGGDVREVNPAFTSQTCSACGHVDSRSRVSQSVFRCTACGHEEHADTNASKNILGRGLRTAVESTEAVCGGFADVGRPVKQKLRVARCGTRSQRLGSSKAPATKTG